MTLRRRTLPLRTISSTDLSLPPTGAHRPAISSLTNPASEITAEAETSTTPSNTQERVQVTTQTEAGSKLDQNIRNILQIIVRYGERPIFDTTVGQYIIDVLDENEIQFENPLYDKIIQEFRLHKNDENFNAENFR